MASTIPGYYTVKEAAEILGVSDSSVHRYVEDGLLKAVDLGRQFVIEQSEVHTFVRPPKGNPTFRRQSA